jgi:hypothetical protein
VIPLHVGGVQSLRPLLALELDGLAFVEALIAVFLDCGEMDENILSGRALNKAITLGPVEPLHDTVLPHRDSFMTASLTRMPLKTPRAAICAQTRATAALRKQEPFVIGNTKTSKETAFRN